MASNAARKIVEEVPVVNSATTAMKAVISSFQDEEGSRARIFAKRALVVNWAKKEGMSQATLVTSLISSIKGWPVFPENHADILKAGKPMSFATVTISGQEYKKKEEFRALNAFVSNLKRHYDKDTLKLIEKVETPKLIIVQNIEDLKKLGVQTLLAKAQVAEIPVPPKQGRMGEARYKEAIIQAIHQGQLKKQANLPTPATKMINHLRDMEEQAMKLKGFEAELRPQIKAKFLELIALLEQAVNYGK